MAARRDATIVWLKVVLWAACLAPFVLLVADLLTDRLAADPVKDIQHRTDLSALVLLLVTLSVTPARTLLRWNPLIRLRRPLGLFAFFYATLHAFSYFVFDQSLSPTGIAEDVLEHPWVTVGFSAFVLLIPLAVTSTTGWIRRLGGPRWRRLHQLVYVSAALGVLHFLWLVKQDTREPVFYGAALVVLLGARLVRRRVTERAARPPAAGERPAAA